MGWTILKVSRPDEEEKFLVWSSITDSPITFSCTAEEAINFFVEDAAERMRKEATEMIERARERGTSSRLGGTVAATISANRAGPNEVEMSVDEVFEFYVRRNEQPTKEALAAYRKSKRR